MTTKAVEGGGQGVRENVMMCRRQMPPGDATRRTFMATEAVEVTGQGRQRSRYVDHTMTKLTGMPSGDMATKGHDNEGMQKCRDVTTTNWNQAEPHEEAHKLNQVQKSGSNSKGRSPANSKKQ